MSKDTVILYGTNTFTRHLIDWDRTDCEFWCWNEIASLKDNRDGYWAKKVDLLIQIHAPAIWRNTSNINDNNHYDWLRSQTNVPVYMQQHYDDVPMSVKYPKEEIIRELLPNIWRDVSGNVDQVENFTSSTAYALALAIYQGKKKIELAGIEMTSDTEYVRQRPGVLFWLGIATGRGVEIVLHSPLLMNDKPYGYTGEVMITRQQFEMSGRKLAEMVEESKQKAFEQKGRTNALLDALLICKDQTQGQRLLAAFLESLNKAQEAAWDYGRLTGAQSENDRYKKQCDDLIMAAGGEKTLKAMMGILDDVKQELNFVQQEDATIETLETVEA